jgi:DNA-3-methyladenine glycosylase II
MTEIPTTEAGPSPAVGGVAEFPSADQASVPEYQAAALALAGREPVIARLLATTGLPQIARPTETPFAALVRAVTQQQLATAAARTIHGRLVTALGGEVTPERLLTLPIDRLRAAGLSGRKAASLTDLSGRIVDGILDLDPEKLARQGDDEIVRELSAVKGIGRWSAEMFLMFQLLRLDVWPTGDLGVRKGYALAWAVPVPTPKQLDASGEAFRPFRSVAAWYCWAALRSG